MLSAEITAQVITVLQARQIEDRAYRAVMAISLATPSEEILSRAKEYERCVQVVQRQERLLSTLCIKQATEESEVVANGQTQTGIYTD